MRNLFFVMAALLCGCVMAPPYHSSFVPVGTTIDAREVYYAPASLRVRQDGELFVWTRWVGANGTAAGELELNCASRQFRQVSQGVGDWNQANAGYALYTLMDQVCR